MSSAAVSNGSPTSRRTAIDRSQSQENALLDDDRLGYQPVSVTVFFRSSILKSRQLSKSLMFSNHYKPITSTFIHLAAHVLISFFIVLTMYTQDRSSMLKKSSSALSSSKNVNQAAPKVSLT